MSRRRCGAPVFLLTGLAWLLVMAAVGMALFVATVRSTPLPATLRLVHAHGALLGGILQMLVGGLLALRPTLDAEHSSSHWGRYLALNLGTIGMLVGFWLHQYLVVGMAGLLALGPLVPFCADGYRLAREGRFGPAWASWYGIFALAAFIPGILFGLAYSFGLAPHQWVIHTRLAHVHLTVLGFLLVLSVGLVQPLAIAAFQTSIWSPRIMRFTAAGFLLGILTLLTGFGMARVPVQLGGGALLLLSTLALGYNLLRTWLASAQPASGSTDHMLLGVLFLNLTMILGLLVGVNFLFEPRPMPFGSLHLVAYTHLTFIGFLLHVIYGSLSAWLPQLLAQERMMSHKKQAPYAARLCAIMDRWRALQVATLTLGTMGLGLVAALTWRYPLGAAPIQYTTWISLGLLLTSLAVFAAKVGMAWGERAETRATEPT